MQLIYSQQIQAEQRRVWQQAAQGLAGNQETDIPLTSEWLPGPANCQWQVVTARSKLGRQAILRQLWCQLPAGNP